MLESPYRKTLENLFILHLFQWTKKPIADEWSTEERELRKSIHSPFGVNEDDTSLHIGVNQDDSFLADANKHGQYSCSQEVEKKR